MIVHHTFTSEANGRYYPAGFYMLQTEYLELSQSDRAYVDRPITPDESAQMMADEMRYAADEDRQNYRDHDERFDNDNEDALRDQDDWDREHEAGRWDYRNDY